MFCSDCSAYECAVPEEQLFRPVRVCRGCYFKLTSVVDARNEPAGKGNIAKQRQ